MGTTFIIGVIGLVICLAIILWLAITEERTPGEGGMIAAVLVVYMLVPLALSAIITVFGAIGWLIQHITWR